MNAMFDNANRENRLCFPDRATLLKITNSAMKDCRPVIVNS